MLAIYLNTTLTWAMEVKIVQAPLVLEKHTNLDQFQTNPKLVHNKVWWQTESFWPISALIPKQIFSCRIFDTHSPGCSKYSCWFTKKPSMTEVDIAIVHNRLITHTGIHCAFHDNLSTGPVWNSLTCDLAFWRLWDVCCTSGGHHLNPLKFQSYILF